MIKNSEIKGYFDTLKENYGDNDTILKLEKCVERMERECFGLKQRVVNLNMKLESFYGTFTKQK